MRIVAGIYRGRKLEAPDGQDTRPTSDRVREALMSSLYSARGASFEGASVLDAFAGTGAMGLEALSRGAAHVTFLDNARGAFALLKRNVGALNLPRGQVTLLQRDVFAAVEHGGMPGAPFGLVFLDPPYSVDSLKIAALLRGLAFARMLCDGALITYEHGEGRSGAKAYDASHVEELCGSDASGFSLIADRRYGKTAVSIIGYDAR